jgi:hypothetical protein
MSDGVVLSRSAIDVSTLRGIGPLQTIYVRAKRSGGNEVTLHGTVAGLDIAVETKISKGSKGYRIVSVKSIDGRLKLVDNGKYIGSDYTHPWMAKCG